MRGMARILLVLAFLSLGSSLHAQSLRDRMLLAEDARPRTAEGQAPLVEGLKSPDPTLRRQAVRAIGRLEQASLVATVQPVLADPDPAVRRAAADALGQLATASNVVDVQRRLVARLGAEPDAATWGAVAATLGRLPYATASQITTTEGLLLDVFPGAGERPTKPKHVGNRDAMLGAARGLEALVRISRKIAPPSPAGLAALRRLTAIDGGGEADPLIRIRRYAWLAVTPLGQFDAPMLEKALADPDEEVRRLAIAAAGADVAIASRAALLEKALGDASPRVRYEALRSWGRQLQTTSCAPVRAALRDASPHVRLQAIDLLGGKCPEPAAHAPIVALAEILTTKPGEWHAPAHALVALARVAPAEAKTRLPRYVAHPTWQVRMYAARAAGVLGATDDLRTLARDAHDNVREAALTAMVEAKRAEAVATALDALSTRADYQLLLTAARALSAQNGLLTSDTHAAARKTLVAALDRLTADQRDTSRDPRVAILERLKELPAPPAAERGALEPQLRPRLSDFDPVVAQRTADVLSAWTGAPQTATPRPLPRPALDLARVPADANLRLRVTMAGRGVFVLELLPDEAPLTVLRLITNAGQGYYNGLTFHRVVPNFVIQGGSPGANEYVGDARFMRDEVGLVRHDRGSVGISTRGRDTGDAQLFVDLTDQARLDHGYTVFAQVVQGMDVVDGILEGDVIERVEVQAATPQP